MIKMRIAAVLAAVNIRDKVSSLLQITRAHHYYYSNGEILSSSRT